jgi:hypothetical protein
LPAFFQKCRYEYRHGSLEGRSTVAAERSSDEPGKPAQGGALCHLLPLHNRRPQDEQCHHRREEDNPRHAD